MVSMHSAPRVIDPGLPGSAKRHRLDLAAAKHDPSGHDRGLDAARQRLPVPGGIAGLAEAGLGVVVPFLAGVENVTSAGAPSASVPAGRPSSAGGLVGQERDDFRQRESAWRWSTSSTTGNAVSRPMMPKGA